MTSFIGVFLGLFYDYSKHLSPGEVGVIQLVAADRQQASVIFGYIRAILHSSPIFEQYITRETAESILLSTRISIEIATASFRSIRGRTCVAFIADELAFWQSEGSSNPDSEIITAIRPSMATIPVSLMICGSTPYGMFGELYETHKRYFGVDNDEILCVQADTRTLNPTISEEFIQKQIERDPAAGRSEWLGLPRDDRELFLSFPMIEACVGHYTERPRLQDQQYHAAGDPSGGRGDSFACAIGHIEDGRLLVDLVREYPPPFDPEAVVREIASILKHYDIEAITTDRYAAAWVSQAFEKA